MNAVAGQVRRRVLVVDDSEFFRNRLVELLGADPRLEVIGTAVDGQDAVRKVMALAPDVVTMDHDMPLLDGVGAVKQIMARRPTPVLMVSAMTHFGSDVTLASFLAGALDFVPKTLANLDGSRGGDLCERVVHLGAVQLEREVRAPSMVAPLAGPRLVVVGASTGGPPALEVLLRGLPAGYAAPVLLVQHLPAQFSRPLVERLDGCSGITVVVAEHGARMQAGTAYLAPGGSQVTLSRDGTLQVRRSPPEHLNQPSVDVTLAAAAEWVGPELLAIVLTGMGSDGAIGAAEVRRRRGQVWVQDPDSALVNGMPRAVIEAGHATDVMPLEVLARRLATGGG